MTTKVDERIRSDLLVDDYRRARISAQVPALERVAPGREDQLLAVEREPHRHHMRLSAGPAGSDLGRARAVAEEGADLLGSHLAGHPAGSFQIAVRTVLAPIRSAPHVASSFNWSIRSGP